MYEDWQQRLSDAFLFPHQGPTVFFLDEEELNRICPESADAPADLVRAVRSRLALSGGRTLFRPITMAFQHWQRGSQADPPPVLPLMAVSVLAATRMRSDALARSTNYYIRLAQTLTGDLEGTEIETLRDDLREGGAFLDVVEMWRGVHSWIEAQGGKRGTSTIRDHSHLQRIGYPLSQALVRQSDRISLTRFFRALAYFPDHPPTSEVLLRALDIWTVAPQNRLSDSFMRSIADADMRLLLGEVVEAHARAWDGRVLTGDGKLRIGIRLSVDLEKWQTRWLFPVPAAGPDALCLKMPGSQQTISLVKTAGHDNYATSDAPAVEAANLTSGLRLLGDEYAAEFPAAQVIFLRPDRQTGAWSSEAGILPFEEHLVVIAAEHTTMFKHMLSEAAADGWRLLPQRGSILLPGFALFSNVRFLDGQKLESTLSELPGLRRIGVTTSVIPRSRLVRGLPIASEISATHYLRGGEPDLLLPTAHESGTATVTLDGLTEEIAANGFPLELRRFIKSGGHHNINADGQDLAFTTIDEHPSPEAPAGTATIGWSGNQQLTGADQTFEILGAHADGSSDAPTVLVRRGREETWLLHESGHAEKLTEPGPPPFLATLEDVTFHLPFFEVPVPQSARWIAQRRSNGWHVAELGTEQLREYLLSIDVIRAWKHACGSPGGKELWELQLSMAGERS